MNRLTCLVVLGAGAHGVAGGKVSHGLVDDHVEVAEVRGGVIGHLHL